jgi:hypothetical protein
VAPLGSHLRFGLRSPDDGWREQSLRDHAFRSLERDPYTDDGGGTPPLREALMSTSEYRDDDSQRFGTVSQAPTKFIQICASQNDLFALDKEGNIYQYNFNAKAWAKLVASRSYE